MAGLSTVDVLADVDEQVGEGGREQGRVGRRRRLTRLLPAAALLLGGLAAVAALQFVAVQGGVGPGDVRLTARWNWGGDTVIDVPPLGHVIVDTHDSPLEIEARVTKIDLDRAGAIAGLSDPVRRLEDDARVDVAPLVVKLVIESLLVAALAGGVVGALLPRRRWRHVALGAVGGVVAVGLLQGWTWQQFRPSAFQAPRFEGALERAPAALEAVKREVGSLGGVRDRLAHLSGQLDELVRTAADPLGAAADGDTRILHVSDIHLNPLGVELARSLAERFDVAAIVDTGDLTSFGSPARTTSATSSTRSPSRTTSCPATTTRRPTAAASTPTRTSRCSTARWSRSVGSASWASPTRRRRWPVASPTTPPRRRAAPKPARWPPTSSGSSPTCSRSAASIRPPMWPASCRWSSPATSTSAPSGTRAAPSSSPSGQRAPGLGSFTVDTGKRYEAELLRFHGGRLVALDYIAMDGVSGAFTIDRTVYPADAAGK